MELKWKQSNNATKSLDSILSKGLLYYNVDDEEPFAQSTCEYFNMFKEIKHYFMLFPSAFKSASLKVCSCPVTFA